VKPEQGFSLREAKAGAAVVEMRGITKRFPGVVANDRIDFEVRAGEVHALLGENGAGKTTLMNVLYGLYQPDEGEIFVHGQKAALKSPRDAIGLGIGMVHQHFMLIPPLTVTENVILGLRSSKEPFLDTNQAEKRIADLSKRYGLKVDPQAQIWQLSVGEQQRVEIIKALYRGADILILDEPTSVLTPPEVRELFVVLQRMAEEGKAVIFITHKLHEVMSVSHRVTVLRDGKAVSTVETGKTDEKELARMMVGREVLFRLTKKPVPKGDIVLQVEDLETLSDRGLPALKCLSFSVRQGEILGIAGVAGNGQKELAEVITGLRKATQGRVIIGGREMTDRSPGEIIEQGVSYIPEERLEVGLIMDFSVAENTILETRRRPPFSDGWFLPSSKTWFLNPQAIKRHAEDLISDYDVKTPSKDVPVKQLSGGNLQRLILARELSRQPKLLIAAQPTRGLDVGATEYIHSRLIKQRERGTAILLISEDLDEVLSLGDRIAVMYEGEIVGIVSGEEAEVEEIGLMMAGAKRMNMESQCSGGAK